jgi:hypothetical protein
MELMAANGGDETGRADREEIIDRRVVTCMLEMRGQGYSFRDIAAALAKQRSITLSPEGVKDILYAHAACTRKACTPGSAAKLT